MLNAGDWLFFGPAVMIGWLEQYTWDVVLATQPVYILIGFLASVPAEGRSARYVELTL